MKIKFALIYCYFVAAIISILPLVKEILDFYSFTEKNCFKQIVISFREAILEETFDRIERNGITFSYIDFPNRLKLEEITIYSENDTIKVKRQKNYDEMSTEEKRIARLQSIMLMEADYLDVNILDSIFNQKLKDSNLYINTGIQYCDTTFRQIKSKEDDIFFSKATVLEKYYTGIKNEITLQGYFILSFKSILIFGKKGFINLGAIGIFILISLIFTSYYIMKYTALHLKNIIPPPKEEEAEYIRIKKANCYALSEGVTFDFDRKMLFTDDGREVILKPLMVQLFMEFVTSPYFYALSTDLWKKIWDRKGDPSNVLTQLISRTREAIEPIEEVEIRNVPRSGYRLVVHSKGEPREETPEEEF